MKKNEFRLLVIKYLDNCITDSEKNRLDNLLSEDPDMKNEFEKIKENFISIKELSVENEMPEYFANLTKKSLNRKKSFRTFILGPKFGLAGAAVILIMTFLLFNKKIDNDNQFGLNDLEIEEIKEYIFDNEIELDYSHINDSLTYDFAEQIITDNQNVNTEEIIEITFNENDSEYFIEDISETDADYIYENLINKNILR